MLICGVVFYRFALTKAVVESIITKNENIKLLALDWSYCNGMDVIKHFERKISLIF